MIQNSQVGFRFLKQTMGSMQLVGTQRQPFQANLVQNFSIKLSRLLLAPNVRKTDEKSLKSE